MSIFDLLVVACLALNSTTLTMLLQVVSKDKKDRRKKSRFGNEEQLKKKSLFPNAVPRIFFNPSRHIRKLESEIISEATIDYPEQGNLSRGTDNCSGVARSVAQGTWSSLYNSFVYIIFTI